MQSLSGTSVWDFEITLSGVGTVVGAEGTFAGLAQLVERVICNLKVAGSTPATGSDKKV